jgi:integrase
MRAVNIRCWLSSSAIAVCGGVKRLRCGRAALMFSAGRLEIVEAMTEVNGRAVFWPPKTHARRSVPVPGSLRSHLSAALEGKRRDEFVFQSPTECALRVGNFRRARFNAAVSAVGLDDFTPHEVRHAAASFAIASGASVKSVQSMLGHRSATVTLDRYAALWGDELDVVAERIDAARTAEISRTNRGPRVVALKRQGRRNTA